MLLFVIIIPHLFIFRYSFTSVCSDILKLKLRLSVYTLRAFIIGQHEKLMTKYCSNKESASLTKVIHKKDIIKTMKIFIIVLVNGFYYSMIILKQELELKLELPF